MTLPPRRKLPNRDGIQDRPARTTTGLYKDCKEEARGYLARPGLLAAAKELNAIAIAGYTGQLGPPHLPTVLRRGGTTSASSAVASSAARPSVLPNATRDYEIDSNNAQGLSTLASSAVASAAAYLQNQAHSWRNQGDHAAAKELYDTVRAGWTSQLGPHQVSTSAAKDDLRISCTTSATLLLRSNFTIQ